MQCITDIGGGNFALIVPQPTEYTTCVYLLAQPQDVTINAYALTVQQGTEIAIAIVTLWAIGYVFRVLSNFLKSKDGETNE